MLEARFATLVDVVTLVRELPGTGVVVTDAYRAAVAAICRSLMLAQLCMDRKLVRNAWKRRTSTRAHCWRR